MSGKPWTPERSAFWWRVVLALVIVSVVLQAASLLLRLNGF